MRLLLVYTVYKMTVCGYTVFPHREDRELTILKELQYIVHNENIFDIFKGSQQAKGEELT